MEVLNMDDVEVFHPLVTTGCLPQETMALRAEKALRTLASPRIGVSMGYIRSTL